MFGVDTFMNCNHFVRPPAQFILVSPSEAMLLFNFIEKFKNLGLCSLFRWINSTKERDIQRMYWI